MLQYCQAASDVTSNGKMFQHCEDVMRRRLRELLSQTCPGGCCGLLTNYSAAWWAAPSTCSNYVQLSDVGPFVSRAAIAETLSIDLISDSDLLDLIKWFQSFEARPANVDSNKLFSEDDEMFLSSPALAKHVLRGIFACKCHLKLAYD